MNASAAARKLGIHIRAAQRWVKRYYKDPESMFEKKKKPGRRRILGEEHKHFLINYIDENPSAVIAEVAEILTQNFVDLKVFFVAQFITSWQLSVIYLLSRHNSSL